MGASRADEQAQRAYLGKLAGNFEKIVGYSLNAYYTEDPIFNDRLDMRLITRIIELNEVFSQIFTQRGHTRCFELSKEEEDDDDDAYPPDTLPRVGYEFPVGLNPDLSDIICADRFQCPKPSNDSIMRHIEDIYRKNRGPELGTVSTET